MSKASLPRVTVVIPSYNRAHCLGRTIQSVIDQTIREWEIVVVDNHSSDDTSQVIASFNDARIKEVKIHNGGVVARSRNKGLELATSRYVAFLDSDDWWMPRKLELSLESLENGADVVYHDLFKITGARWTRAIGGRVETRSLESPARNSLLAFGNALTNSSVVVRKNLIQEIGGFSVEPRLVGSEDFDCWLRLSLLTDKFHRVNSVLGCYWAGGGNLTDAARTVVNLDYLVELYGDEVNKVSAGRLAPGWLCYSYARALIETKESSRCAEYCLAGLDGELPVWLKLKLLYTYFEAKVLNRLS